jgi:hypothetical protein
MPASSFERFPMEPDSEPTPTQPRQPISRGSYSRNAARFSLAAPTFWMLIGCLAARPIANMANDSVADIGWWLNLIVGIITLGIVVGGLVLGIIAAIAGKRENNQETFGMGLVGAFFNVCVLFFFAFVFWWWIQAP